MLRQAVEAFVVNSESINSLAGLKKKQVGCALDDCLNSEQDKYKIIAYERLTSLYFSLIT